MDNFDCCVVVSETDKHLLADTGVKSPMIVVPNGTDTDFFKPTGGKRRRNLVLWIGHMDVHTNRDAVLYFWREIYPVLRRECPPVEMTFVGTAPPREIAHAAQRDSNVEVTGFVDDIRPYLDEATVVVVPIRIGSGTRIKILDAMAMGRAIVSTTVGAEGLEVRHGQNILIADAPTDFVQAVIRLIKDEGKREELERNARRTAMQYDWKKLYEIQEQVYATALRRKGRKAT
jgi:glycosyltransferase involved in cell wall biosynthesis